MSRPLSLNSVRTRSRNRTLLGECKLCPLRDDPTEPLVTAAGLADRLVNILSFLTTTVNGVGQSGRSEIFEDRERPFSQEIVNMLAKRLPVFYARAHRLSEPPGSDYAVDIPVAIAWQNASFASARLFTYLKELR